MTLLESLGAIFTGIWTFFSLPASCAVYGLVIIIVGVLMTLAAIFSPHYDRSEFWERMSFAVGGPLVAILGLGISMWAVTSSPDGITWA